MRFFRFICLVMLFAQSEVSFAEEEYLIVKGNILNQISVPEAQHSMCSEKNIICMNSYYRYTIKVLESLSDESPKIIQAASYQHGPWYYRGSDNYVFVLEPISEEASRRVLGANYMMEERILQKSEFCFKQELTSYMNSDTAYSEALKDNCVDADKTFSGMKKRLLLDMRAAIWEELESKKYYVDGYRVGMDKSGNLYFPDDEEPEICSEDELDTYDTDTWRECSPWTDDIEIIEFVLAKGVASKVIEMIEEKVNGLPFSGVRSELSLTSKSQHDILRWTYEVITL